jgi:hypothetical protein
LAELGGVLRQRGTSRSREKQMIAPVDFSEA